MNKGSLTEHWRISNLKHITEVLFTLFAISNQRILPVKVLYLNKETSMHGANKS